MTNPRVPLRAWAVLLLSGFAGALFYLDRQTLSVLKTTLKLERGWTDTDYGWLVSAFMLCYTACSLFTGRWIDRWGTRRIMTLFIGVMSLATILCGLSSHLQEMAASRALLGLAEAGIMPAIYVATFAWFPPGQRGTASTIKEPLYVTGLILAAPLAVWFTRHWSWHAAFVVPGAVGMLVAAGWWLLDRAPPGPATATAAAPASYFDALRRPELWGVIVARLISDPLWFFLFYWEPGFLQERLGMSLGELGRLGWIPTAVATTALLISGAFSDWLVRRLGWSPARSRRIILQGLACLAPTVLALRFTENHILAIVLLSFARIMLVGWLNLTNLFMADLVPHKLIGTSIALMSAFGAATGLLCNAFIGPVIGTIGYGGIFTIGACLHPLAALILWRCYRKPSRGAQAV
jgi:MFS transporter, ACS family, hexuronate transporter